jgi:hypothetical protein
MKYEVNVVDGCADLHGNKRKGEHVIIFADGCINLSANKVHLSGPSLCDLFSFVADLRRLP